MFLCLVDLLQWSPRPPPCRRAAARAVRPACRARGGLSNDRAAQAREAFAALRRLGVRCLIHQPRYSMLDRWVERDGLLDALVEEGVGCIVFSPLAQGVLTDNISTDPEDLRAQRAAVAARWGARAFPTIRSHRATIAADRPAFRPADRPSGAEMGAARRAGDFGRGGGRTSGRSTTASTRSTGQPCHSDLDESTALAAK